ncbi:MAG: aldo/keto reductase [Clostridia bacterium]|nr:aldo/keto reductase [Clostridia bacterium]
MVTRKVYECNLSHLGMGNMRLPVLDGKSGVPIDFEKAQQIIDYAMEQGINYYDSAYVYHSGESEKFLGEAMKKYPRESYHLATKFLLQANPDYKAVFEEQLSRLKTEHIDFYLLHAISDGNADKYLESGCIEYYEQQKAAGRIKHFGFSFHGSPQTLTRFLDSHSFDFVQIQLNYFDWNYGTAKQEYEILSGRNIPIIVMEPVRGGRLAKLTPETEGILHEAHPDWSCASWAFRFVKGLAGVKVILSGMSNMEQIMDNVKTFEGDEALTIEDEATLMKACAAFRSQVVVPCTECRYCCDDCPAKINIPEYLKLYNNYKLNGWWQLNSLEKVDSEGKPSDCIACGACTAHCPQNIEIPTIMKTIAEAMKGKDE